jgi:hypothetical protein
MSDLGTTIDTYLAAWGEPDETRRAALIDQAWAVDGRLIDPPLVGEDHDGISEMAKTMQSLYPGHTFRRTSGIDAHHEHLRFSWELVGPDGAVVLNGIDVGDLADDGRLQRITGFFGDLPAFEKV